MSPGLTCWDKDSIGYQSFAVGTNTKAKGQYSFASGILSEARGFNAIAMGGSNRATRDKDFLRHQFTIRCIFE